MLSPHSFSPVNDFHIVWRWTSYSIKLIWTCVPWEGSNMGKRSSQNVTWTHHVCRVRDWLGDIGSLFSVWCQVLLRFLVSCLSFINLSKSPLPATHILRHSCALYLSFMSFLTAVFLYFLRTWGPSGLCTTVLTLCMRSHLLQLEAFLFSLSLFQTHT